MSAEPIQEFLATRGIESLGHCPVMNHEGQPVTLAEALASCEPARRSIDSTLAIIRDMGGEEADVLPAMTKHIERMGQEAQGARPAPETSGAGKK
jgi:hypothetical protein